jgi:hypothetical protein
MRLADAGEKERAMNAALLKAQEPNSRDVEVLSTLKEEAAAVRALPSFGTLPDMDANATDSGEEILATFRKLRRMAQMEVAGEGLGASLLMASAAAENPVTTMAAYGGVVAVVMCAAFCQTRWQTIRDFFQLSTVFMNCCWTGMWLILGVVSAFASRDPLRLVPHAHLPGFTLLLMCGYVCMAAANIGLLTITRGAAEQAFALVCVLVGSLLYWILYSTGQSNRVISGGEESILVSHSHLFYLSFAILFAIFSVRGLRTIGSQQPKVRGAAGNKNRKQARSKSRSGRSEGARMEHGEVVETEMFVIDDAEAYD